MQRLVDGKTSPATRIRQSIQRVLPPFNPWLEAIEVEPIAEASAEHADRQDTSS
jgi:hypothetical protein